MPVHQCEVPKRAKAKREEPEIVDVEVARWHDNRVEVHETSRSSPQAFKPILSCHSIWCCSWRGFFAFIYDFSWLEALARSLVRSYAHPGCRRPCFLFPQPPTSTLARARARVPAGPSFYLAVFLSFVCSLSQLKRWSFFSSLVGARFFPCPYFVRSLAARSLARSFLRLFSRSLLRSRLNSILFHTAGDMKEVGSQVSFHFYRSLVFVGAF